MAETIKKAWGFEDVLVNEAEYCAKRLWIHPGKQCSLHYHKIKKETFLVEKGVVELELPDWQGQLREGEMAIVYPGEAHRFASLEGAVILEVSTHHDDSDVIRLEPSGEIHSQV